MINYINNLTLTPIILKGRHTGLPLQITAYSGAVGANLCVRPSLSYLSERLYFQKIKWQP